ncbi:MULTISPECIES: DUF1850 domain-containing protein [Brucella]|nr:DUF1850 domain-containing protein [Brucella intermedia]
MNIAATSFVHSWTHCVEKLPWREVWNVTPQGLVLSEAPVQAWTRPLLPFSRTVGYLSSKHSSAS